MDKQSRFDISQRQARRSCKPWRVSASHVFGRSPWNTAFQSHLPVIGIKVCMAVFLYANSASRHDLHTVQSHLDADMAVPPTHGNVSSTVWHAVSEADKVRDFIQHYASVHGLPQPSAPRCHNMPAPTYLPSSCTKLLVQALYVKAGGSVSYQTWLRSWARDCPSVIIMQPKEDVCGECSDLQSKIVRDKTEVSRQQLADKLKETHGGS